MKHIKNTQWFSLVLALWLTLLLSFTALYILEYMVPFSRNISGVEHASNAYYQSAGGIENALFERSSNIIGYEDTQAFSGGPQDFNYNIVAQWTSIPRQGVGEGTSTATFPTSQLWDWNKLSLQEPIQLLVGRSRLIGSGIPTIQLQIQVPDFDASGSRDVLSTLTDDDLVIWQLSSTLNSLSSTWSSFSRESQINTWVSKNLMRVTELWVLKSGLGSNFLAFYNSNCLGTSECVLKISLIREIVSASSNSKLPYLEYKIQTNRAIPIQSSILSSQWKSYWFSKNLEIQIPQLTTNSAFDFTLFQ